ncbi:MAG: DUF362 domain-containing protein [Treponematales bacterium]
MNTRRFQRMIAALLLSLSLGLFAACAAKAKAAVNSPAENPSAATLPGDTTPAAAVSKVYFTSDISPAGLMAIYNALGQKASGKVAVKVSTGEPPSSNYLRQELIGSFVKSLNGTYVECMTAYGGARASAAMAKQVAKDHGFSPFDLMDDEGDVALPVPQGKNIKENLVGSHIGNYDFFVILSHFKGHQMAGLGGAIKNVAIGMASANGKTRIHTAGVTDSPAQLWANLAKQDAFLESMAEATASVVQRVSKDRIIYINVMNRLSVDCDCNGNPAEPDIHDIGILSSLDPVALDKACVDLVYTAEGNASLVQRIEAQNGVHCIAYGAEIGLGSLDYELVRLE